MDTDSSDQPPHHPSLTLTLPDGRVLAWAEYGDPDGAPLIFHHGIPSSRMAAAVLDGAADRNGVRLIAPDRPGYGLSDPKPGRRIPDWPADVKALADHLGLPTFSVAAISAGLPYTLACALQMPQRLDRVAIVSGLGRIENAQTLDGMSYEWRLIYSLFLKSRRLASLWMRGYGRAAKRRPERVLAQQIKRMPPVDGEILGRSQISANRIADLQQAFRQGPAAAGDEALLHIEPWGFELGDVDFPVSLWQGALDESHPLGMGRRIASCLPQCRPLYVDEVGSLSFITHADAVFANIFPERASGSALAMLKQLPIVPAVSEEAEAEASPLAALEVLPKPVPGDPLR